VQECDIIELLRRKDPNGAAELISHYGPLMQYIIRPIVADPQDREECFSEAVMRILDKIHLYDEERGSFRAWITSVTRSVALNKHRSIKIPYEKAEVTEQTPSTEPTPEEQILQQEQRRELRNAISQLSQNDRVIFYRKYYYLQTTAQIASEIGMTPRAVEGRLYRIKKRLRKLLGGDGNG
jgi:RNA polymerase sigma-70 factor (ECF subfamily)